MSIYVAHPINTYETPIEDRLIAQIRLKWYKHPIVNPGSPQHQEVVARLKAENPTTNVMEYFVQLASQSEILVALPFPDGKWGRGVYKEAEAVFRQKGHYVWVAHPSTLRISRVNALTAHVALSVEETRNRVYFPDRTLRPYE
jgi:hypothetical protein